MEFHWRRIIVKEYQTAFLWMAGLTFLVAKENYFDWGYEASKHTLWGLMGLFAGIFAAFLLAWSLKKTKVVRAD